MNPIKKAFGVYARHCDAIRESETERRHALAQAEKCRSRNDDCGYGKWLAAARQHTVDALRASNKAGIRGVAAYAGGISSVNLIARMDDAHS